MSQVRVEVPGTGEIVLLTLDRPERRNAVSGAMLGDLLAALEGPASAPGVRAVLLGGAGQDFCAGADIAELATAGAPPAEYGGAIERVLRAIQDHPVPVIAQVQGAALGAGCQLAVACDLAIAAEDARIGIPSARLGIVINIENIVRLVLAVGRKRAGEILFTGRAISGREAAAWGLVNEAVPAEGLRARAEHLARQIADMAPLSVRASKSGIRAAIRAMSLDRDGDGSGLDTFDRLAEEVYSSEDLAEGIRAFGERRDPRFGGR